MLSPLLHIVSVYRCMIVSVSVIVLCFLLYDLVCYLQCLSVVIVCCLMLCCVESGLSRVVFFYVSSV